MFKTHLPLMLYLRFSPISAYSEHMTPIVFFFSRFILGLIDPKQCKFFLIWTEGLMIKGVMW